jgi:hypothetical protein
MHFLTRPFGALALSLTSVPTSPALAQAQHHHRMGNPPSTDTTEPRIALTVT